MDDLAAMNLTDVDLLLRLLGEWGGREDELLDRRNALTHPTCIKREAAAS